LNGDASMGSTDTPQLGKGEKNLRKKGPERKILADRKGKATTTLSLTRKWTGMRGGEMKLKPEEQKVHYDMKKKKNRMQETQPSPKRKKKRKVGSEANTRSHRDMKKAVKFNGKLLREAEGVS